MAAMTLIEQLHAAHLTYEAVERLTAGAVNVNALKKAQAGIVPLTPERAALVNRAIAAWRMAQEHAKVVVFEAVQVQAVSATAGK